MPAHPAPKDTSRARAKPSRSSADGEATQFVQAYARIEELIATLKLAPGQVISENLLAGMLGFGRTPVREALQQLAREGLVVIMPRRGIVVAPIDVRKQLRLLEMRRCVERCVVQLAARRSTDREKQAFKELADRMEASAADGEMFLALDAEFNLMLLDASRNEYAVSSMKTMQGMSRRFWFAHYQSAANLAETTRLHAAIARAIAKGSEKDAAKALDMLMDNVEAFTRATLDT